MKSLGVYVRFSDLFLGFWGLGVTSLRVYVRFSGFLGGFSGLGDKGLGFAAFRPTKTGLARQQP